MKISFPIVVIITAFAIFGGMCLGKYLTLREATAAPVAAPGMVSTDVKPEWFKEVTVNGFAYMIYTGPGQICNLSDWQVPPEGKPETEPEAKPPMASKVIPVPLPKK